MAALLAPSFDSRTREPRLAGEVWKPIPEWLGYEVSSLGRLRSYKKRGSNGGLRSEARLNALKFCKQTGHLGVTLADRERRRYWPLQNLVLTVHVGPCPEGMEACHNDGNALDCRVDNLRWGTHQSNCVDRSWHGRGGKQKLSASDIPRIRGMIAAGYPQTVIAEEYGVNYRSIGSIGTGVTWGYVPGCEAVPPYAPLERAC